MAVVARGIRLRSSAPATRVTRGRDEHHASPTYRPDIDGLRAVAILLVVLFHAGVSGFVGGFVGVDMFFVISGFVITAGLLREYETSGRVGLLAFWGRRGRRLLPVATVMIVAVVAAGAFVYSPLSLPRLVDEAWATTLYRSNFHFDARSTNYFDHSAARSPLLHTWSLSVEERFYLLWPVVVLAASRLLPGRRRLGVVFAALGSVSFVMAARASRPFFSPSARAYEFAIGALVAIVAPVAQRQLQRASVARTLCAAGIVMVTTGLVTVDAGTRFPSMQTNLPVLGTALAIAGGSRRADPVARVLSLRPLLTIGKLSYSWYLWH